jgi:hypothetical protein
MSGFHTGVAAPEGHQIDVKLIENMIPWKAVTVSNALDHTTKLKTSAVTTSFLMQSIQSDSELFLLSNMFSSNAV